ncbi:MAG: redoxin domain-containing protein [Candidatus Hydrogenedentes bacterium]|nr:redoxin domain-containing protein [Candidatus Hydrogenedentota bacterium]
MKTKVLLSCGALAVVAGAAVFAVMGNGIVQADVPPAPEIGTKAPDFTLKDYDGKDHSLSAHAGSIVVLVFTSQECPYSRAGDKALSKFAESYKDKGVVVLSIDSHAGATAEAVKEFATKGNETGKALPYPILIDTKNVYADKMGAKKTPEVYIVDKSGSLVYHGALDNGKKLDEAGYESYVAIAVDELLAGKPVSKPKSAAYGCGIKRAS